MTKSRQGLLDQADELQRLFLRRMMPTKGPCALRDGAKAVILKTGKNPSAYCRGCDRSIADLLAEERARNAATTDTLQ